MMVDFCVQRRGEVLVSISAADATELKRLPERRIITLTATLRAPPKLKRWYWAMCSLLVEATGRWASKEIAHHEFMCLAGMVESLVISTNGDYRITPVSVAVWTHTEWRDYLDRLLPIIIDRFVGETRAQFRNRVNEMVGIKAQEIWENG